MFVSRFDERFGKSPRSNAADVDVHELRWIESDSARLHSDSDFSDLLEAAPGDLDIRSHAVHMQAVGRDLCAVTAKHRVRLRRTISGNDMKRFGRLEFSTNTPEQIQQTAINRMNCSGSVVSQQSIDLTERLGDVSSIRPVNNLKLLERVKVIER